MLAWTGGRSHKAVGEINFGGDLSNKAFSKKSIEKRKEAEDLTSPPFRVLVAIKEEMTAKLKLRRRLTVWIQSVGGTVIVEYEHRIPRSGDLQHFSSLPVFSVGSFS
jgi:hypothetical protein